MFRTRSRRSRRSLALAFSFALPLAAALVPALGSSTAFADPPAEAARTTVSGSFQRYLLMPNGRPMGLMLSDGTFVPTPGHALRSDAPVLTTGTRLDIEGVPVRTPTGGLVRGAVVKVNGAVIADASAQHGGRHGKHHDGARHERHELTPQTGAGQIAAIVSGPRGKVRALVLTDGTTAVAHGIEGFGLKIGDRITVTGKGGVYPLGKSIHVERVTLPNGQTRDLPARGAGDHGGQNPT